MVDIPNDPEFAAAIRASGERLGISPLDLATTISYETGGSFDPWQKGPTTKWGQHRGLIQFGEPQQQQYGVHSGQTAAEQMGAVEAYLRDRGVKPGMGLLDVYSTINAGRPGLYGASDAAAGGAPGTVADKVASMAAHKIRARALLGEPITGGVAPAAAAVAPGASAASAPMGLAPHDDASDQAFQGLLQMMKTAQAQADEESALRPLPPLRINFPETALRRSIAARRG